MYPEKLPNGKMRLVARYKDPYTNKMKRTSVPLASESSQAYNKAARALNEKISKLTIKTGEHDFTFGELLEEWKESHSKRVKPRTMKTYEHPIEIIRTFISDDILVKNIDVRLLQKLSDNLVSRYADNSARLIKQPLNIMLNYAVKMGYMTKNPLPEIEAPKRKYVKDEDVFYLESHEFKEIIDEVRTHPDSAHIANFAEAIYLTGMRPGELLALQWEKVDFDKKQIRIHYTLDYTTNGHAKATLTTTKNDGSYRTISAPDRVLEIFREEQTYQCLNDIMSPFVFVSKRGNHLSINTINRSLKKASFRRFGVKITSHKFRHAHITLLAELNVPLKAVMKRVGHVDSKTTLRIYTHVTEKMGHELMDKLNSIEFAP